MLPLVMALMVTAGLLARLYYRSTIGYMTLNFQGREVIIKLPLNKTQPSRAFMPKCPNKTCGPYEHGIPKKDNFGAILRELMNSELMVEHSNNGESRCCGWAPNDCIPTNEPIALILPVRGRPHHIQIYLSRIRSFLQIQKIPYIIITVNQSDNEPFNRGILFNLGTIHAPEQYNCFVMSDVDMIPDMFDNMYTCNKTHPKHLSPSISKFGYKLIYVKNFGGVVSFKRKHFEKINGFSNRYWGWGAEDDDLYNRVVKEFKSIDRVPTNVGRFTHLDHHKNESGEINTERFDLLKAKYDYQTEGLNTVTSLCTLIHLSYYEDRIDVTVHCRKKR